MKLTVKVKPNAKTPAIHREADEVIVAVREPARDGRANEAVRRALAEWLEVAPSRVRILRGTSSRLKIVEVDD
jgi:uncharacterized protein YggU (UPF0235/DUF167 family)